MTICKYWNRQGWEIQGNLCHLFDTHRGSDCGTPKPFCLQCHTRANPITQILHIITTSFPSSYAEVVVWAFFPLKYKAHWHANNSGERGLSQFQSSHWCSSITCCVLYWGQQRGPTFPGFHPFKGSALLPQASATRHISGIVTWPVKKCAENV